MELARKRTAVKPWSKSLTVLPNNVAHAVARGIELCRKGRSKEALEHFDFAERVRKRHEELPAIFYSFYGYARAAERGEHEAGIELCEQAIRAEFFQPESYLNLARTHLLRQRREAAVDALDRGLAVIPDDPSLRSLRQELGVRQRPTFPFLPRSSAANKATGLLRYRFRLYRMRRRLQKETRHLL